MSKAVHDDTEKPEVSVTSYTLVIEGSCIKVSIETKHPELVFSLCRNSTVTITLHWVVIMTVSPVATTRQ